MNTTARKPIDAVAAYENAHLVAQGLLARIGELLCDWPAPDEEWPIDWEHVGTINEVNQRLSQIVSFLEPVP